MSFFNRPDVKPTQGDPLPKTENPNTPPPALPPMSPERAQAIAALMSTGRIKSIAHALFLNKCDELDLPE